MKSLILNMGEAASLVDSLQMNPTVKIFYLKKTMGFVFEREGEFTRVRVVID